MATPDAEIHVTFKIRHGSTEHTFSFDSRYLKLEVSHLAPIIRERTNIPEEAQKLLVPGIGLVRPGVDRTHRTIEVLKDKKMRVIGTPAEKVHNNPVSIKGLAERQARASYDAAKARLKKRLKAVAKTLGESPEQIRTVDEALLGRRQTEELEEGEIPQPPRRFGALADPNDATPKGRLHRLIGVGFIPRLDCKDNADPCPGCREAFVLEWCHLAHVYIDYALGMAEHFVGDRRPTLEEADMLAELEQIHEDLWGEQEAWIMGIHASPRALCYIIRRMIRDLELTNCEIENNPRDECVADIDSFFVMLGMITRTPSDAASWQDDVKEGMDALALSDDGNDNEFDEPLFNSFIDWEGGQGRARAMATVCVGPHLGDKRKRVDGAWDNFNEPPPKRRMIGTRWGQKSRTSRNADCNPGDDTTRSKAEMGPGSRESADIADIAKEDDEAKPDREDNK